MKMTFPTIVLKDDTLDATGISVPAEIIEGFGKKKRPPVKVTIGGYTYRTTVAVFGDEYILPLNKEHRNAAGVLPGQVIEITLELDEEPQDIPVPTDLAAALNQAPGAMAAFEALAPSRRKEHVRLVESAKAQETRQRRITGIVSRLTQG